MILHWALTNCLSFGSFERYLIALAHHLALNGQRLTIIVGDKMCDDVREAFAAAPMHVIEKPMAQLEQASVCVQMITNIAPQLVHFHFTSFGHDLLDAITALPCPIVFTDHASTTRNEQRLRLLYKSTSKLRRNQTMPIHHIIAVSDYVKRRVLAWQDVDPAMVTRVYNGIDLETYKPASAQLRNAARRTITARTKGNYWAGFAGQLTREKGLLTFLNATLRFKNEEATFVIIGDGPLRDIVQKTAASQPNLIYLGRRSDMPQLLPMLDLLVVPSHFQEAFGLVAAEALACGVPVLVSQTGGLPEVLGQNPLCGQQTRQTSSKHIALDIRAMMDHPNRDAQRAAARAQAKDNFDINVQLQQTADIYNKLLPAAPLAKSANPRQD